MQLYESTHRAEYRECVRCGIRRRTRPSRGDHLCRDCKYTTRFMGETHVWMDTGDEGEAA